MSVDRICRFALSVAVAGALVPSVALAQCFAPVLNPDTGFAISPFGVDRSSSPGASSGWHLGLDIQKTENTTGAGSKTSPLYAPVSGTVTAIPNAGKAGNMLSFNRADGAVIQYLHMDRFAPKFQGAKAVPVQAGEYVGELGGTPSFAKHLHLQMKVPLNSAQDYRDKMYAAVPGAKSILNQPFTAAKLKSGYKPDSTMVFVDPQYWLNRQYAWVGDVSKYQSQGFKMAPGNKTLPPSCAAIGGDNGALAQQQAIDAMGGQDPSQMTSGDLAQRGIQDGDRIGVVDAPSYASYADLSESELIQVEAGRRMTDAGWEHQVAAAGVRGLAVEMARIRAAQLYIEQRLEEKKQRVEALYAALLALRVKQLAKSDK